MVDLRGTGPLLRLNLRRDRLLIPIWLAAAAAAAGGSAQATVGLYPDESARRVAAELINAAPALVALYGRIYDTASLGAIAMIKLVGMGTAIVALFGLLTVIRHSRADEESGVGELAAAGMVGRDAPLAAAVLTAFSGSAAIGVATAVSLVATGLPAAGSWAFGLAWTLAGCSFAAIAAIAAQLTVTARAARGLAGAVLVTAYILRGAGDAAGRGPARVLVWASPIGWSQQLRPYAGDRWPIAAVGLAAIAVSSALAFALRHRRDWSAGVLPHRSGPAGAARSLTGSLGLAWRLHRSALSAWAVGIAVLGLVFGQVLSRVADMLTTPQVRALIVRLGGVQVLADAFAGLMLGVVAVAAAGYGVAATLRAGEEETDGRADPVLAGSVSRPSWAGGHLVVGLVGSAALLGVGGLAVGAAPAAQGGDPAVLWHSFVAAALRIPAAWVMVGLAVAAYGLARRAAAAAWVLLVAAVLLTEVGPLLEAPRWLLDVSPFTHMPALPGGHAEAAPLLVLLAVAAGLSALGLVAIRRRDLAVH